MAVLFSANARTEKRAMQLLCSSQGVLVFLSTVANFFEEWCFLRKHARELYAIAMQLQLHSQRVVNFLRQQATQCHGANQ